MQITDDRFNTPAGGVANVNDLWNWFLWLFFLPGDYLIALLDETAFGRFFNLGKVPYDGWVAGIVSLIAWWLIFSLISDLIYFLFGRRRSTYYSRHRRREPGEKMDDLL